MISPQHRQWWRPRTEKSETQPKALSHTEHLDLQLSGSQQLVGMAWSVTARASSSCLSAPGTMFRPWAAV
jgi:hypothetical protein